MTDSRCTQARLMVRTRVLRLATAVVVGGTGMAYACPAIAGPDPAVTPVIDTTSGKVQGQVMTFHDGIPVVTGPGSKLPPGAPLIYSFKGIPFASAPVNAADPINGISLGNQTTTLFTPADPAKVVDARYPAGICPQPDLAASTGKPTIIGEFRGLDCLHVNVKTRSLNPGAGQAVLVWIHGGSFIEGSNAVPYDDGSAFARDGVVTVEVNYRLGAQGFLLHEGMPGVTPNPGVQDWIVALQWVQQNIGKFGGDPKRVSIMGQSAGGGAVSALMTMPAAQALYDKAIVMSGAIAGLNDAATARKHTADFAAKLGKSWADASFNDVLAIQPDVIPNWPSGDPRYYSGTQLAAQDLRNGKFGIGLTPAVGDLGNPAPGSEPWYIPYTAMDAPRDKPAGVGKPLLIGTTTQEFLGAFAPSPGPDVNSEQFAGFLKDYLPEDNACTYKTHLINDLGYGSPGTEYVLLGQLIGDWSLRVPALKVARKRYEYHKGLGQADPTRTYFYQFDQPGVHGTAGHSNDLPYVFDTLNLPYAQSTMAGSTPDRAVAKAMHRSWVSFVKTGKPGWDEYSTWNGMPGQKPKGKVFGSTGAGIEPAEILAQLERTADLAWDYTTK